jgi:hypothetical protein
MAWLNRTNSIEQLEGFDIRENLHCRSNVYSTGRLKISTTEWCCYAQSIGHDIETVVFITSGALKELSWGSKRDAPQNWENNEDRRMHG